jgi:hypothetical protein
VTTGPRPHAADIRISTASVVGGVVACDAFEENLTTGLFEVGDFQPGSVAGGTFVCIKNMGSAAVGLTASVIDLIDTDPDCTGDEPEAGDATCGGSQAGELSTVVTVLIGQLTCEHNQPTTFAEHQPRQLDRQPRGDSGHRGAGRRELRPL